MSHDINAALAPTRDKLHERIAELESSLAEREGQLATLLEEHTTLRVFRFNETSGCIYGGRSHPDRCKCQGAEDTPHKHYGEPPHRCARCGKCDAYAPAIPSQIPAAEAYTKKIRDEAIAEMQGKLDKAKRIYNIDTGVLRKQVFSERTRREAAEKRAEEMRAELDAIKGEPHADRCAQSHRLKIQLAEAKDICASQLTNIAQLRSEITRLESQRDRLRELLKPIGEMYPTVCFDESYRDGWIALGGNDCGQRVEITIGQIRAIRAALAESEGEVKQPIEGAYGKALNISASTDLPSNPTPDARDEKPIWRCAGCGETFDDDRISHPRHDANCDGSCRRCPVQCGPVMPYNAAASDYQMLLAERDGLQSMLTQTTRERDALATKLKDLAAELEAAKFSNVETSRLTNEIHTEHIDTLNANLLAANRLNARLIEERSELNAKLTKEKKRRDHINKVCEQVLARIGEVLGVDPHTTYIAGHIAKLQAKLSESEARGREAEKRMRDVAAALRRWTQERGLLNEHNVINAAAELTRPLSPPSPTPDPREGELEKLARALVDRLDLVHEHSSYKAVWTLHSVHGGVYNGPTYEYELDSLRAFLRSPNPSSGSKGGE